MQDFFFEIEIKVRDYECDIQGIVNNAIYLNYMEHTRHELLASLGVNFIDLHNSGIDPVVAHIEVDYKTPLKSGDVFISKVQLKKEGVKHVFHHEIVGKQHQKTHVKAKVEVVTLVNGKLSRGEDLDKILHNGSVNE